MRIKKERNSMVAPAKAMSSLANDEKRDEMDKSLSEILEIVKLSREVQGIPETYENKSRRIITIEDFHTEINLVRY